MLVAMVDCGELVPRRRVLILGSGVTPLQGDLWQEIGKSSSHAEKTASEHRLPDDARKTRDKFCWNLWNKTTVSSRGVETL